jgi:hypothetical protein
VKSRPFYDKEISDEKFDDKFADKFDDKKK